MHSYIRESHDMGNGRRYIVRYTPGEYLAFNIIKFLCFLCIVWPIQLEFWMGFFIIKSILKALWWIISLPFRLIFHKKTI